MNERITSLSRKQVDALCYVFDNFIMNMHLLLVKAHKEKDSPSPFYFEPQRCADIMGRGITDWPPGTEEDLFEFEDTIGKATARRMTEEMICFLVHWVVDRCCRPYVAKNQLTGLLDRLYENAFRGLMGPAPPRVMYTVYAEADNPLETLAVKLAMVLDEDIFNGLQWVAIMTPALSALKRIVADLLHGKGVWRHIPD